MGKKLGAFLFLVGTFLPMSDAVASTVLDNQPVESVASDEVKYEGPLLIKLGTRVDYNREYQKSDLVEGTSGFKGNNLMISIQGNITNRFSFRFRQRISELKHTNSFFDGTDFMYLKYCFNNKWDVTAGKLAVEFGNAEYQREPSEQYILSEYWRNLPCYKFGLNVGFNATENDRMVMQVAESPFKTKENDLYAYAVSWYGNHSWFHTMYSVNMIEYQRGKYVYNLCFGNQLQFDKVKVNFDYMNRITDKHQFFKDITVRGEVMVQPNKHLNFIAMAIYNGNKTHEFGDFYLKKGTELTHFGGFVEYSPIPDKDKSLKIHAGYNYYFGQDGYKNGEPALNRHLVSLGVQWEMNIVALAKKIWDRN